MKTVIVTAIIFVTGLLFQKVHAQISVVEKSETELKVDMLNAKKAEIRQAEKEKLKTQVEAINSRLEKNEISWKEAQTLKKEAAQKTVLNIEDKLNIIDARIALLQRNQDESFRPSIGYNFFGDNEEKKVMDSIPKRTTSGPFLAFGLNNAIPEKGGLDKSPYKIGGSRFFEIGYEFTTTLSKNGFVRLKYGFSFQFNGLKPETNQYFVMDGEQTYLEEYPDHLEKSKFRNDNLVIPVHFEFGSSKIVQDSDDAYYSMEEAFKFGIGGYMGLNLNSVQKLKYEEDGNNKKMKLKKGYNTTNLVYGLSVYLGYDYYALYLKYDMSPIFTDNRIAENNISLGVRVAF